MTESSGLLATRGIARIVKNIRDHLAVCAVGSKKFEPFDIGYSEIHGKLPYIASLASALSMSGKPEERREALRIAHFFLLDKKVPSHYSGVAKTIFSNLKNFESFRLAEESNPSKNEAANIFSLMRSMRNRTEAEEVIAGRVLYLNPFQSQFWALLSSPGDISVSAATSVGKSFIVERWLASKIRSMKSGAILYVVPTRALIQQVENDFYQLLKDSNIQNCQIVSIPSPDFIYDKKVNLLILTQERYHFLRNLLRHSLAPEVVVVDEAQKIGDGSRGILLEQVLESIRNESPSTKFLYLTPSSENPDLFIEGNSRAGEALVSSDQMVGQNLFWVDQSETDPKKWKVRRIDGEVASDIGLLRLDSKPSSKSKRVSFVAYAVGGNRSGNLVYANGAAEAEKVALQICDLLGEKNIVEDPTVQSLIEFTSKTVHAKYALNVTLKYGVAFHYGNIPLILKSEIENLFRSGRIRYLVCTSTLIEGVNTACRNIFVRGPQKGRGRPMTEMDFWNLAGRAGRWGKEFEGNIFCIDASDEKIWLKGHAPKEKVRFKVTRASVDAAKDVENLCQALNVTGSGREFVRRSPESEYLSSYLLNLSFRGSVTSNSLLSRFDLSTSEANEVYATIQETKNTISIAPRVVQRNPGIAPSLMKDLYQYFEKRGHDPERYAPLSPSHIDSAVRFAEIFTRTYKFLGSKLGPPGKRPFALAILVNNWMRGWPISRIIQDRYKREREKRQAVNLAAVIRTVLEDVEKIARFEAPKYLSCYTDILSEYYRDIGRNDLVENLEDFNIFLEFGVSDHTQISMMSLGLSRTSAILLSEYITDDSLGKEDVLRWLRLFDFAGIDLPDMVEREVEKALIRSG